MVPFLFILCVFVQSSVTSDSLQPYGLQPARLLCPWSFPGKNTGVGCDALLQRIFPTQRWSPHLLRFLHGQAGSFPLGSLGSPDLTCRRKPEPLLSWRSAWFAWTPAVPTGGRGRLPGHLLHWCVHTLGPDLPLSCLEAEPGKDL